MNYSRPPISLSIWLMLFGFQIAVVTSSIRRRRRRSHHNDANIIREVAANEEEDLISQLSDDILISIIGVLRTKDAVRTSILSKRWRNLYKFVPNVDFRCEYLFGRCCVRVPHDSSMLINGVDKFLRLRSGFKIRSLYLNCCLMKLSADRYEQFIYSLGRLGIERLALFSSSCNMTTNYTFACQLLSQMPSLECFYLEGCSLHQMRSLKQHFDVGLCSLHQMPKLTLPNNSQLQLLTLSRVTVLIGALECILSNCMCLHSLSIEFCKFTSKSLSLCGPNLQLKRLRIEFCTGVEEIEFYASNLVTFDIQNDEVVSFIFNHAPRLEKIALDFANNNTMSYVCTKLAKDMPHPKSLYFASKGDIYRISSTIHTFSNLRQLKLCIYVTDKLNLLSLAPFLQSCPLLQVFHLDTEFVEYHEQEVKRPDAVIHQELKEVEITGHGGTKVEIEFALYILRSAICLEEMQICRCPKWYRRQGAWTGRDKPPWSNETLEMIHKQLRGQALSKYARLTIRHSPIYEFKFWSCDCYFGPSIFD